jgi:hypothetical protein
MASEHTRNDENSAFSFGVRELREAKDPQRARAAQLQPAKSARESSGSDPYNTSGSFDRSRNWMRVGKR